MECSVTPLESPAPPQPAVGPAPGPSPASSPVSTADRLVEDIAPPPRRWPRWRSASALLVVLALGLAAADRAGIAGGGTPTPAPSPTAVRYDARGRIEPTTRARVATLQGGIVRSISRAPGEAVAARDELARLETPLGATEVLFAPFQGTVLAISAQAGDSLLAGAPIATVGDLTALRVETTDVDEYLVGSLRLGQAIEVSIDALGGRVLSGRISGITLAPQPTGSGDLHYPVYVGLDRADPGLRPGMTVRLRVRPDGG
jgi:multidrug efflux pump subunit AcrA (membrane-fusion protein)